MTLNPWESSCPNYVPFCLRGARLWIQNVLDVRALFKCHCAGGLYILYPGPPNGRGMMARRAAVVMGLRVLKSRSILDFIVWLVCQVSAIVREAGIISAGSERCGFDLCSEYSWWYWFDTRIYKMYHFVYF